MEADTDIWAHSPAERGGTPHTLTRHLVDVAVRAKRLARDFGGGDLAYWVGLWHDLGKCNPKWQKYLRVRAAGRPHEMIPHAIWGAALVYRLVAKVQGVDEDWKEVALPIHGHHAGLTHGQELGQKLQHFLEVEPDAISIMWEYARSLPAVPSLPRRKQDSLRRELFIRMVFSALVDADSLDTEQYKEAHTSSLRHWHEPTSDEDGERQEMIHALREELDRSQERLLASAKNEGGEVNAVRREVYEACRENDLPSGIYRLTVPTGGGKTRSGLAFALRHAERWGHQRVIVAIPYTSIIDQTAKEYRDLMFREFSERLGRDVVLEHHSQFVPPDDEAVDERCLRLQLATENWDAPIVVTTTVQLFESLFSNRRSSVRKLHNIAKSVIVLDEVQTLPPHLLEPTFDMLRGLVDEYDVTVVLSTATQPALEEVTRLKALRGMEIPQIVPDYPSHFMRLRRVDYHLRPEPMSWQSVAAELRGHGQVLAVVNTRRDAIALIQAVGRGIPGLFHLSTLLCGAHRRKVLADVQSRLDPGNPLLVCLISTQVIEAGVDLDFPWAYRALGPFDRLTQTAGRCNREGKLDGMGQVVIFEPLDGHVPQGAFGAYRHGVDEARQMLREYGAESLQHPDRQREYFRQLFDGLIPLDGKNVQFERRRLNYPAVAQRYRLIEEDTVPVVVDYEDGLARLDAWRRTPGRVTWQRLQPYIVDVYVSDVARWEGSLEQVTEGVYRWTGEYDELIGLPLFLDPSDPGDELQRPSA